MSEAERNARTLTMIRVVDWLEAHPKCSIAEFHEAKHEIYNQARADAEDGVVPKMFMGMARARYNSAIAANYELAEANVISSYKAGNSIIGISHELDIPEVTVRNMIKKWHARETHV